MKDRTKRTNVKQLNHLLRYSLMGFIFLSLIASIVTTIMIISYSSTNNIIKMQIHEVDENINTLEGKNNEIIRYKK